MLLLKLVNETATQATYNYYPEGQELFGVATVDKSNGDISILKIADNDEFRRYLGHAAIKLKEFYEKTLYEKEVIVAWC